MQDRYIVTETCQYEVDADSPEEATDVVADAIRGVAEDSGVSFIGVTKREARKAGA